MSGSGEKSLLVRLLPQESRQKFVTLVFEPPAKLYVESPEGFEGEFDLTEDFAGALKTLVKLLWTEWDSRATSPEVVDLFQE